MEVEMFLCDWIFLRVQGCVLICCCLMMNATKQKCMETECNRVPKYCTAVLVKDFMEQRLPQVDPSSPTYDRDRLLRSAAKSATAGVAGAALTNPLDVIRNEMFKTNESLVATIRRLVNETGYGFCTRGMAKNMVAVAIPVGCTIFFTDALIQFTTKRKSESDDADSRRR